MLVANLQPVRWGFAVETLQGEQIYYRDILVLFITDTGTVCIEVAPEYPRPATPLIRQDGLCIYIF